MYFDRETEVTYVKSLFIILKTGRIRIIIINLVLTLVLIFCPLILTL